jgi:outer membrane protein assembly factor BamB
VFVALDAKTGDKLWATPRKPFRACYSSPLVREVGGATEVIDVSSAGATAYDPATGAIRWNWDWPFDGMVLRTVASPLLAGDVLVLVSGDGGGSRSMVVLDIATKSPKKLWEKRRDTPYVPGVVALGDHLYWVTDAGVATCAETRTGKIVWSERAFNKPVSASPVLAGDTVLTIAEDGKAIAFKATPAGFEKLASNALGEAVFGTPAASNGRLIVRGATHLFAFGPK